ncbi:hypothetical protein ACJJTC_006549 [Scirpophaga incertulas]
MTPVQSGANITTFSDLTKWLFCGKSCTGNNVIRSSSEQRFQLQRRLISEEESDGEEPATMGGARWRRGRPPAVTFSVEHEHDHEDGQITFTAPTRPLSLHETRPSPSQKPRKLRSTDAVNRASAELKCSPSASDDESAPLVSPQSDTTDASSPRDAFDVLPADKDCGKRTRTVLGPSLGSGSSLCNMVEPYNMRLLAHGTADGGRLWRQDALDAGPPWPWNDPDEAV